MTLTISRIAALLGLLALPAAPAAAKDAPFVEFRISFKGDPKWSKRRTLEDTREHIHANLKRLVGPYRVKVRGKSEWTNWEGLPITMQRVVTRLKLGKDVEIGDVVLIENEGKSAYQAGGLVPIVTGQKLLRVRIIGVQPPNTVGTPKVDTLHYALWREFPHLESWGIANCRKISGSSSWSQHAWGNAEDLHLDLPKKSLKASLDPVARWLRAHQGRYQIKNIIWWQDDHYDHIHVDMAPGKTGTPPCAG